MPKQTIRSSWVLAMSTAVLTIVLTAASPNHLVGYPLIEDGYYSLAIARHIALGHGITIDGSTWTNGFQPLWVFLLVPIYSLTSGARVATLRAVLACAALIWIATAWLVSEFASRFRTSQADAVRAWTLVLYLTSATIFEQHFNGLETGLLLLMFSALGCATTRRPWTAARTVVIGVLCGLLVLTRIDTALFVLLFSGTIACVPRSDLAKHRISRAATIALISAIVSSPWWLYNLLRFGSLLPSSGSAVFDWEWRPGRAMVLGLYTAGHAIPLPIRTYWPWRYEWCAVTVLAAAAIVLLRRGDRRSAVYTLMALDNYRGAGFVVSLLFYVGVIIFVYAMSPAWWMYERYTSPVVVLSVPALALVIARVMPRQVGVVAPLAALCLLATVRANLRSPLNGSYQSQVRVVQRHVPDGVAVGALQSGTLGYFRDHVVNLDGKVNAAALPARGHLDDYAQTIELNWLADWPGLLERGFGSLEGWRLVERVDDPDCPPCGFALYRRAAVAESTSSIRSSVLR